MSKNLNNESQEHRPLCVLSVSDRVADDLWAPDNQTDTLVRNLDEAHVLKEDLEDTASLLVYQTGDTLDTTTTGETTDSLGGGGTG